MNRKFLVIPTYYRVLLWVLTAALLHSCVPDGGNRISEEYLAEMETWKATRDAGLRSENGYVNLAGLFWFTDSVNTIGSSSSNVHRFPAEAPALMGSFEIRDSSVSFIPVEPDLVKVDGKGTDQPVLVYDRAQGVDKMMEVRRYRWFIIERAGNFGIRLRDLEHPNTMETLPIERYPVSGDWIIEAVYETFDSPRKLNIENIIGFSEEEEVSGRLRFTVEGREFALVPLESEDGFFVLFGDRTNGEETYHSGRFLWTSLPDEEGKVTLDFNKAYNPPCAFTDFATCPIPPPVNDLDLSVRAGEKDFHF